MALNFPDNPSLNDTYVDSTSGFTYVWNGTVWISTVDRKIGNIKQIDDISASFDGSQTVFTIYSNGQVIAPLETNKTIISVGGVLQNPGDDYSVFGTQITFSTAPNNGLTFFGQVLQTDQSKSTLADRSVGPEGLSTGGFAWNSSGDFIVSGILTSGTSSITIDGSANEITVGTAATINESGITAGIVTGTFYGDGANLDGVSGIIGATESVNTSGIITASSFTGDGRNLTDVGGYLAGLIYSPGIGNTEAATGTGIAITFTKSIEKNSGVINLRENSISGTIAESFDIATVGSSSTISISGAKLTITPASTLGTGTTYFVEVPANAVRDTYDTGGNLGITSFTFVTSSTPPYSDPFDGTFQLFTAGSGSSGVLGKNSQIPYSSPAQIPGNQWRYVTNQRNSAIGTKTDGSLWAWGNASDGVLGLANNEHRSSPTQIPGTWDDIFMGGATSRYAMATRTDGTLWAWGNGGYGNLGVNNTTDYQSPVQIPGSQWKLAGVQEGNESDRMSYAFKTDGTMWVWGDNGYGSLGQNSTVSYSSPIQVPGTWSTKNGQSHKQRPMMAIKTDNSLWVWGYNAAGELGINDRIYRSSPIQVPGEWKFTSAGQVTFAIKTDGTLWAFGGNGANGGYAQNNAVNNYSSPVQIPGTQWETVSGGNYFYCATKTDGTFWMWGQSAPGRFGNNTNAAVAYSSPIQVPGTQWGYGQVSEGSTFFLKDYS